jgi:hypothetical protein
MHKPNHTPTFAMIESLRRRAVAATSVEDRLTLEARGLLATRYAMRACGLPSMMMFGRPVTFNGVSR